MSFETFEQPVVIEPLIDREELSEEDIVPERADHLGGLLAEAVADRFTLKKSETERTPASLRETIVAGFNQIAAQAEKQELDLNEEVKVEDAVSGDKISKTKTAVLHGVLRFFDNYEIPFTVNNKKVDLKIDLTDLQLKQVFSDILVKFLGWEGEEFEKEDDPTFDDSYDDDGFGGDSEEEGLGDDSERF